MRYTPGHKEEKRKELLKASGGLAKRNGFAATGVDALMQVAGVTSGAFYGHFSSKSELFTALIESEVQASCQRWQNNPDQDIDEWIDHTLNHYLSKWHIQHPEAGCVLPALLAEIGRANDTTKSVFAQEMRKGLDTLAQRLGSQELAWALISQLIGTVQMVRAIPDTATQQNILEASKRFVKHAIASSRVAAAAENKSPVTPQSQ